VNIGAIGNDVVDLEDPVVAEHHRRPRFVSRVCAAEEFERIATARDLWTLFAAKEAAYKALVNLGYSPGFAHREIRVSEDLRAVRWRDVCLSLSLQSDHGHVHAVAWSASSHAPRAKVSRAETAESQAARELLCELVATTTHYQARDLMVVRDPLPGAWDGYGPPRLEHLGTAVDVAISLSHDGRFVAAAALI
jgi:phosphopantetheinyl transferase (holo-ACP synthase)